MDESWLSKIKNRASKRVDWLAIGLSFLFIGAIPTGEIPMMPLQIAALVIGFIFIVGAISLRMRGEMPSFHKAYRNSSVVWGLWHSGGRTRRNKLHVNYNSLKRILLLDPYSEEFDNYFENYLDTPERAREDIVLLTREAVGKGVEVKWYARMQSHAITIFNPNTEKGWVVVEEHQLFMSCADRPRKCLTCNMLEYDSIITKFNNLWGKSRIPEIKEYCIGGKQDNERNEL